MRARSKLELSPHFVLLDSLPIRLRNELIRSLIHLDVITKYGHGIVTVFRKDGTISKGEGYNTILDIGKGELADLMIAVVTNTLNNINIGTSDASPNDATKTDLVSPALPNPYIQKDTNSDLSGYTDGGGTIEVRKEMSEGTAATVDLTISIAGSSSEKLVFISSSSIPNLSEWENQTWTWKLEVVVANTSLEIDEVIIRRISSDGNTIRASKSSGTGLAVQLTAGVKTGTITWNDGTQNPAGKQASDRIVCTFVIKNNNASIQTADIRTKGTNDRVQRGAERQAISSGGRFRTNLLLTFSVLVPSTKFERPVTVKELLLSFDPRGDGKGCARAAITAVTINAGDSARADYEIQL
jgi:hypothetical protein